MPGRSTDAQPLPGVAPWLAGLLWWLFVVSVPLLLVSASVCSVALNPETYRQGFAKYGAARATGLDEAQLDEVARGFIDFFRGGSSHLDILVERSGQPVPLFNQREVDHMADVHRLMRGVGTLQALAAAYLAIFAIAAVALSGSGAMRELGTGLIAGAVLTIGLLLLVGALSLTDFTSLFVRFHELSFRNDLWMLDPSRDALLMLFPEGFWLDVTLRIAAMTAVEALMAGVVGGGLVFLAPR